MTGAPYSDLSEASLAVRDQVRQVIAAAKAAGRWACEPLEDPERFAGPVGADNSGFIATYPTLEQLHDAAVLHAMRQRLPGLFDDPPR
ncbi:MAG TPA: hypothetical protein VFY38_06355 [Pseudonocardia sp.]|nr:hypothetical protein [Pseudonocardia sp.]